LHLIGRFFGEYFGDSFKIFDNGSFITSTFEISGTGRWLITVEKDILLFDGIDFGFDGAGRPCLARPSAFRNT